MPFVLAIGLVTLLMSPLLVPFVRFSLGNDLYSHVILIPLVSAYLVWQIRGTFTPGSAPLRALATLPTSLGAVCLGLLWFDRPTAAQDAMALTGAAYVCFAWTAALALVGRDTLRKTVFPLAFLLAMVPFPTAVESAIETFLQHGSAACAYAMFQLAGTTLYRNDLIFHLPGITLEVAPQCSGIRSSLVLLITSLVGGYLFLRSPVRRTILSLAVIPLALVRNGFRVFVLGELCVEVGPHMIDSAIHHRGGPIFFALSLIPFMGLVWLLMRGERKKTPKAPPSKELPTSPHSSSAHP
jgi:exosortase C (VPDSG-CTERM-specific)